MMKLFRKYNKQILAGLTAFLMIIFLGGDALQRLVTPERNVVIASSEFGKIRLNDHNEATLHCKILDALGFPWNNPVSGASQQLTQLDWMLLTREAERYGALPPVEAINAWMGAQQSSDRVEIVARGLNVKPSQIFEAIRGYRAVLHTAKAVQAAAVPSSAEVRMAAVNELDKVKIRAAVLPASAFVDKAQTFTDEEQTAHFEKYKNERKGEGLQFGYFLPPSVKVQYLKIDRDAVAAKVGVANLDAKAKQYYDENKDVFRRPPSSDPPPMPPGEEPCEEGDPRYEELKTYYQWNEDDAKWIATDLVRKRAADEAVTRLTDWLVPHMTETWGDITTDTKTGYKTAPASLASPDYFAEVVKRIPANLMYEGAVTVAATDFFSADKSREVGDVGQAAVRSARGTLESLKTLAFRNSQFIKQVPGDKGVDPADYLAMFQPSKYPLSDTKGNVYIVRVIDAKEEHAPASLAEVRDQVNTDLRTLRAYEKGKQYAEALLAEIKQGKALKDAFEGNTDLAPVRSTAGGGFFDAQPFARVPTGAGSRGRAPGGTFIPGGPGRVSNDVADKIFAMETSGEKFALHELSERPGYLVLEFVEATKGREDEFEKIRERLVQRMTDDRQIAAIRDWLDAGNIRIRTGFKFKGAESEASGATQ